MIKLSNSIPDVMDVNDEQSLMDLFIAIKLCVEELATKAQSVQLELRTTAPPTTDLEEGEFVRATVGGLEYIYTKKNGIIKKWQLT